MEGTVKPLFKNLLQQELQGLDSTWFNPFCQLIEQKNPRVPWNSSRWFLFPFNGYQYTKHWFFRPPPLHPNTAPKWIGKPSPYEPPKN